MSKAYNKFIQLLKSSVSNISQSFYDSFVERNTVLRARAGIKCYIIRRQVNECCKWCANLAGVYEIGREPADVYKRHRNCKCTITFKSEKGSYPDVWYRREFEKQKKARISREKEILNKIRNNSKISARNQAGALNSKNDPDYKKRDRHAELYYNELRNIDIEYTIESITSNTKIDRQLVERAYKYVFIERHNLEKGYTYFDSDYDMAESFRRLRTNDNIKQHDIILLKHEALESRIWDENPNMSYEQVHNIAQKQYNYSKALLEWKKKNGNIWNGFKRW